jgi:hypothetical protein
LDRIFARPTESQAGQGHADLDDRKKPLGVGKQLERGVRTGNALLRHLPEARLAHREQGNFRSGKEGVDCDNQRNQQESIS